MAEDFASEMADRRAPVRPGQTTPTASWQGLHDLLVVLSEGKDVLPPPVLEHFDGLEAELTQWLEGAGDGS